MNIRKGLTLLFFMTALFVASPQTVFAAPCSSPYYIEQQFPSTGAEQTRWRLCWRMEKKYGLIITSADFRKSPTSPWVRVFWDARIAEIFVPYHTGTPRFYDIMNYNWPWVPITNTHCPASAGKRLGSGPDICKEVRDRGVSWADDALVRRGQELVLWGVIDASNYNYIIEWTFRDDGTILGRSGATGLIFAGHEETGHMHTTTWRLDVDFNGSSGDSVYLGTHTETGLTGNDTQSQIFNETGVTWDPEKFSEFNVYDATLKNARGHQSSYRLMPLRWGTARHDEAFTKNDFWVTRQKVGELYAANLPSYVLPSDPVSGTDIVIWYSGSAHHRVRDEDGIHDAAGNWTGVTQMIWSAFTMMPHNLFDKSPLFP